MKRATCAPLKPLKQTNHPFKLTQTHKLVFKLERNLKFSIIS